ncbi:MAG TPA: DedA family protein [Dictyobacter sp.]|jgi:membrane protein DedA with SNARE-associated domain|nr:DedA family protein [Dictyobacter sp.]
MNHLFVINVGQLLATYGYWAVFIFVGIESIGIPFPGETMLLVSSITAGTTHQLSIVPILLTATAGAIVGDNIGYWVGRKGGFQLLYRYGHIIRLDERKLKLGIYLFHKHGGKVVFFGRFVTILRTWAAFLAGTNQMSWLRFAIFNALGSSIWATIYGLGGYFLGHEVERFAAPVDIVLGVLAVCAFVIGVIILRRHQHQLENIAEQAFPGPLADYIYRGKHSIHSSANIQKGLD